jgi:hypothetical protein
MNTNEHSVCVRYPDLTGRCAVGLDSAADRKKAHRGRSKWYKLEQATQADPTSHVTVFPSGTSLTETVFIRVHQWLSPRGAMVGEPG